MPCCGAESPEHTSEVTYQEPGFEVVCDESNNSPEDVARGVLNVDTTVTPAMIITDTTDWSGFGWDPETGKCRACGADQSDYQCASPTCHGCVSKEDRFCKGCQGAYDLALGEVRVELVGGSTPAQVRADMERVMKALRREPPDESA